MILIASIDADGNWVPGLGDNTIYGWGITLAYGLGVWVCVRAGRRERAALRSGAAGLHPLFWLLMTFGLAFLCVNKQLDLQTLLAQTGRRTARDMGWYEQRRALQAMFIGAVALGAAASVGVVAWWIRGSLRRYGLAAIGAGYLAVFIVMRAASFHHIDSVLYHIPGLGMFVNRGLELLGIGSIAWGAWRAGRGSAGRGRAAGAGG